MSSLSYIRICSMLWKLFVVSMKVWKMRDRANTFISALYSSLADECKKKKNSPKTSIPIDSVMTRKPDSSLLVRIPWCDVFVTWYILKIRPVRLSNAQEQTPLLPCSCMEEFPPCGTYMFTKTPTVLNIHESTLNLLSVTQKKKIKNQTHF